MKPWQVPLVSDRVLVTGGGSGIGRDVALTLAGLGARTYVLGRRVDALEQTASLAGESGSVVPVGGDARDPESLETAFATIEADGGPVPALVHCAASVEYCPARDLEPAAFREVVESILLGTFNTVHRWAAPLLDAASPGVAIALTSCIAARGTPGAAHSSAAKAGVEGMIRTMAREWGPAGVRLNAVGPGFFPVERTQAMWDDPDVSAPIRDVIALGRPGTLNEVTGPIVFMLSEAATYFTGEVLVPDGGFHLTPQVLPRWKF
jgi:NAD(P)-dependent dehydrogenase (short-subunit alcohol dehydrogenase family)